MSLYQACRPVLEAACATQPDPSVPVWDFEFRGWPWSKSWRAFPESQVAVLRAFLAESSGCYLQMDPSDVLDWPPTKYWSRPYKETFQLPSGLDAGELTRNLLYLGGYRLYCAPAPVEPSQLQLDPWRTAPDELHDSLSRLGITALIAAFHDNDSWRLCFPNQLAADQHG
jgi:hypothetical protein